MVNALLDAGATAAQGPDEPLPYYLIWRAFLAFGWTTLWGPLGRSSIPAVPFGIL